MTKEELEKLDADLDAFTEPASAFLGSVPTRRMDEHPGILVFAPKVYWGELGPQQKVDQVKVISQWRRLKPDLDRANTLLPKGQRVALEEILKTIEQWLELDSNWKLSEIPQQNMAEFRQLLDGARATVQLLIGVTD